MNLSRKIDSQDKFVLNTMSFSEFRKAQRGEEHVAEFLASRGLLVRDEKVERPLFRWLPEGAPVNDLGVLNRGILDERAHAGYTYRLSRRGMAAIGRVIPKQELQSGSGAIHQALEEAEGFGL